jgi:hypothetical protein
VPKELFQYPATAKVFSFLEETSQRSGVSRGQAFEDFLTMSVCSLSGQRMEDLYLQTVANSGRDRATTNGQCCCIDY